MAEKEATARALEAVKEPFRSKFARVFPLGKGRGGGSFCPNQTSCTRHLMRVGVGIRKPFEKMSHAGENIHFGKDRSRLRCRATSAEAMLLCSAFCGDVHAFGIKQHKKQELSHTLAITH